MLFEFQEQFMIGPFLIKLAQFEKTRSIAIFFIPLGNLNIKTHFRNELNQVFRDIYTFAVR